MLKNITIIALLIFITNCGYQAQYSKKNIINYNNFSIDRINFIGDRDVNIKIKERLSIYSNIKKDKNFTLEVNTEVLKTVIGKDIKGDPSLFNLEIKTIVLLKNQNNIETQILLIENNKYKNSEDKFEIKRNEKEIKINLAEKISSDLIYRMSNFE